MLGLAFRVRATARTVGQHTSPAARPARRHLEGLRAVSGVPRRPRAHPGYPVTDGRSPMIGHRRSRRPRAGRGADRIQARSGALATAV